MICDYMDAGLAAVHHEEVNIMSGFCSMFLSIRESAHF